MPTTREPAVADPDALARQDGVDAELRGGRRSEHDRRVAGGRRVEEAPLRRLPLERASRSGSHGARRDAARRADRDAVGAADRGVDVCPSPVTASTPLDAPDHAGAPTAAAPHRRPRTTRPGATVSRFGAEPVELGERGRPWRSRRCRPRRPSRRSRSRCRAPRARRARAACAGRSSRRAARSPASSRLGDRRRAHRCAPRVADDPAVAHLDPARQRRARARGRA